MEFGQEEFKELLKEHLEDVKDEESWKCDKDTETIKIWTNREGTEIYDTKKWVKSQVIYPIKYETMVKVCKTGIHDMAKAHKMIKKHKVFIQEKDTDVIFFVMRIPIPLVSNRYCLIRRRWEEGEKVFFIIDRTIESEDYKFEVKKEIRMRSMNMRRYEFNDENSTKMTSISVSNMGGNMKKMESIFEKMGGAGMMVKMIQKDIENHCTQAKKIESNEEKNEEKEEEEEEEESESEEEDDEEEDT